MAPYGSNSFSLQIDKSDGGTLQDMTPYIESFGDININDGVIEKTPFGVTAAAYLAGVIKKYEPITVGGTYDDTATTGPNAVFGGTHAVSRSAVITIGGTKTISGEVLLSNYKRAGKVGEYWQYSVDLQFTGTVTEA